MTTMQARKRGGQPSNSNAYKHGRYSRERIAFNAEIRAHIKRCKVLAKGTHSNFAPAEAAEK